MAKHKMLRDRVAIVTGSSGGIGRAIAPGSPSTARPSSCTTTRGASRLRSLPQNSGISVGGRLLPGGDLTRPDEVTDVFNAAVDAFGGVDIVVANAGVSAKPTPLALVSDEVFERVINGNTRGTFYVLREAARRVRDDGRIIIVGSLTIAHPAAGFGAYAASKALDLLLPRILAAELGGRRITANAVSAGPTDVGLLVSFNAEQKAVLAKASPLGRLGTAADTADIIAFVASDDARWLSGQILVANGAATV